MEDIINEYEPIIRNIASKFNLVGFSFEELVQIGRIKVWNIYSDRERLKIEDKFIKKYIITSLKNRYKGLYKSSRTNKRKALSSALSLDAEIGDTGRNLLDFIPVNEVESIFSEDMLKKVKEKALSVRKPNIIRAVVWVLVEIIGINKSEIPRVLNYYAFVKYKLGQYLWIFFNNSPFRAINYAYPGEYSDLDFNRRPLNYWKGKKGKYRFKKYIKNILSKLNYDESYYPKLLNQAFFDEFRLNGALQILFKYDRCKMLEYLFPSKYHPWEFDVTPRGYFDNFNNIEKAVKWLVEEKFGYNIEAMTIKDIWREKIAYKVTKRVFCEYGLRKIIDIYNSPEPILRKIYPNKFLPWSFMSKPKWKGEEGKILARQATRWVIEKFAGLNPKTTHMGYKFFIENGLRGMITAKSLGFNSSPRLAIENAYPEINLDNLDY